MTLRIGKFTTRCIVPRGRERAAALANETARDVLSRDLNARLGPSLDREAPVVRLRRLNLTLRLGPENLGRERLGEVWAAALARSVHEALARPEGDGDLLKRFKSRAAYLAAATAYVLGGAGRGKPWWFPELADLSGRRPALVILDLLLQSGDLLGDVLAELDAARHLVPALKLLDEVGLERVLSQLAETEAAGNSSLTAGQLVFIAAALTASGEQFKGGEAALRRRAIELWLRLGRETPARGLWNGLKLLLLLLEEPSLLADAGELPSPLAEKMSRLPPWCERLRLELARSQRAKADAMLEQLRPVTPSAAPRSGVTDARWIGSNCAGLLLLYPIILRLNWLKLYRDAAIGPRTFQALVAGAAMRLLGPWSPGDRIEYAAALLAGLTDEASHHGVAQSLASTPPPHLDFAPEAKTWTDALDGAANALALGLGARVRGFRAAPREAVVRHFLQRPGRILVSEKEVRIVLDSSPWGVALHISGADDAVENVEWLERRSVTYVLEGL